jgi:hypothetical protein
VGLVANCHKSGIGYDYQTYGFSAVYAQAATTSDMAYLYGSSASRNAFVGMATQSVMTGNGYFNMARGFSQVYAYPGTSSDVANLYGSNFTTPNPCGWNPFTFCINPYPDGYAISGPGYRVLIPDYSIAFSSVTFHQA